MAFRNKYLIISMITTVATCIILAIFLAFAPNKIEVALNWVQLGCLILSLVGMVDIIRNEKLTLFYEIQLGAVLCFTLGQLFWITHLMVLGYDDESFSISDISWIGFYFFLLSAVTGVLNPRGNDKGKKITKYKIIALIAAAIVVGSGGIQLFFVVKHDLNDIFYVIIYTAVMAPLSYFSVKLLVQPTGENPRIKPMKPYLFLINTILMADIAWTFSDFFTHGLIFYLCEFLLSIMILLIVPTAYGGYREWEIY